MTGGRQTSKVNGLRFGTVDPTPDQDWLRLNGSGIYVPFSSQRLDALVDFPTPATQKIPVIGTDGLLTFIDVPSGGSPPNPTRSVNFGTNSYRREILNIPTWSTKCLIYGCGGGGSGSSGQAISTTTTACNGGHAGAGGWFNEYWFFTDFLRTLGTTLLIDLSAFATGGAQTVTASTVLIPSNAGAKGGDVIVMGGNGTEVFKAEGGQGGSATAGGNHNILGGNATNTQGNGTPGTNGNTGSTGLGAASTQSAVYQAVGGAAGGGINTSNVQGNGGIAGKGGLNRRKATETLPTQATTAGQAGGNAINTTDPRGIPHPGNSGGGGAANTSVSGVGGRGGDGQNGGGGGGGGAGRGAGGRGGDGGRCWCVVEFY